MADANTAAPAASTTGTVAANPTTTENAANVLTTEQKRLFKVKENDVEREVDESELIKGYQSNRASQERFREASQIQNQAKEIIKAFQSNPKEAFKQLGVDPLQWAQSVLSEEMENQLLSPEEKEKRDLKKKLQEFESEKKTKEETEAKEKFEREYQHHLNDISNKMVEAINKTGLPRTSQTVKRIAEYMLAAKNHGQDLEPMDVVDLVREDYNNDIKALLGNSNEDEILKFLGDELSEKAIKAKMKKVTDKQQVTNPKIDPSVNKNRPKADDINVNKKKSANDYFKKKRSERF